jgi:GT2 family glycosyltransferase/glycosyltransferase involved in cell wall biosynthesis
LLLLTAILFRISDCFPPTRRPRQDRLPRRDRVSIVIPNWNGRDLLEKYLPTVVAAAKRLPGSEVIVVDNGSSDGSVDWIRDHEPSVRILALSDNRGFGGGSNAGFEAASNDIIVLLNNDMRPEPDFLFHLVETFQDDRVFAASCQIYFSDSTKPREETGLTQGWWEAGSLRVRHRLDVGVTAAYPCFYGGGGSCAFDRRKFLELGGFDEILAPFYLEDTDLGYMAWKRGWKVLYQPRSIVYHEHRGTIGKRFTPAEIDAVLKKNYLLFVWKNIHDWRMLAEHFLQAGLAAAVSLFAGDSPERTNLAGIWKAFRQLPGVLRARRRAQELAEVPDAEAFRRPFGGVYRDRFERLPEKPERLSVLFVSPYPICPPVHGGGVFMYQTIRELARHCDLHLIVLLDYPHELAAHEELHEYCRSVEFFVRMEGRQKRLGSVEPYAVREFRDANLEWLIHRQIYSQAVDVLQLEYLVMGQYAGGFHQIPSIVFEHDVYFQSIARQLPGMAGLTKLKAWWEYLRALRYELRLLPRADRIQVCSRDNREYLESFLPELRGRIDDHLRAGIDTGRYEFHPDGREPETMLFLGSFRHQPNQEALHWFLREVLPRIRESRPQARLVIVGSDPPPRHGLPNQGEGVELAGFVEDVREPLARYAVFVCPILSGSGVRVKLLEAFAAGIPVVSTYVGAEGLTTQDGAICRLASDPFVFANHVIELFAHEEQARELARRAREFVVEQRDMKRMTARLLENYRDTVSAMRRKVQPPESGASTAAPTDRGILQPAP